MKTTITLEDKEWLEISIHELAFFFVGICLAAGQFYTVIAALGLVLLVQPKHRGTPIILKHKIRVKQ
jgi:hypothetical protein